MFGHQCKCPPCVVCSGGGGDVRKGRCRSDLSEYVCMYVHCNMQMSCGIQLCKFVHQLQCRRQVCVWGVGEGGDYTCHHSVYEPLKVDCGYKHMPCIGCGTTLAVCSIGGVTKCALVTFLEGRRLPDMCNQRKITLGSTVASAVNMWDRCTLYHLLCKCTNPPWL